MAGKAAQTSREMRNDVRWGGFRQVLPGWIADDSTLTALMPYRQGLLPSVRAFVEHLAAELPKGGRISILRSCGTLSRCLPNVGAGSNSTESTETTRLLRARHERPKK